jgi:hypothetical protein
MDRTVNLDYQRVPGAEKIKYKLLVGVLTPEFNPIQSSIPKYIPKDGFGAG